MGILIAALLAILVVAVIAYPFIRHRFSPELPSAPRVPEEKGRRAGPAIYEDIETLRFEFELGSIDEKEYQERLRAYRLQAASTLRDRERRDLEIDRSLEEEILAARAQRGSEDGS